MVLDPARLLAWGIGGTVLVLLLLDSATHAALSPAFRALLPFDWHANLLLLFVLVAAFLLRDRPASARAVELVAGRPWLVAACAFPLFCAASLLAYRTHPLSMDEYSALFQARIFAAGHATGSFPPELVDRLVPPFLLDHFFTASRISGEISSTYWPGFSLLLAPFVWLGAPWAANPALGAIAIPCVHRLAREITGSRHAAAWAIALLVASPAFVVASTSFYSMQAHLLANLIYALLLLRPTVARTLAAGVVGSFALVLHNPFPHLLFAVAYLPWVFWRHGWRLAIPLVLAYLPLAMGLGFGWREHLAGLTAATAQASATVAAADASRYLRTAWHAFTNVLTMPDWNGAHARLLGLSKVWTWSAAGLLVVSAYGAAAKQVRLPSPLLAAFVISVLGYFFVRFDQGHGWGFRYLHHAYFVLPVVAACALTQPGADRLRAMAAWAVVLSLILANGLRLVQVESFIARHQAQVPPLLGPVAPGTREVLLVDIRRGFYTHDLVQNDPFLRDPRIVMVRGEPGATHALMARHFPGYRRTQAGAWGELWSSREAAR